MKYFYSKSTQGFYIDKINNVIPQDAVEITEKEWRELLDGQKKGLQIHSDGINKPKLRDTVYANDARITNVLSKRNRLLRQSDFTQLPDFPGDNISWAQYRESLRDVPEQIGFPADIVWPVEPA